MIAAISTKCLQEIWGTAFDVIDHPALVTTVCCFIRVVPIDVLFFSRGSIDVSPLPANIIHSQFLYVPFLSPAVSLQSPPCVVVIAVFTHMKLFAKQVSVGEKRGSVHDFVRWTEFLKHIYRPSIIRQLGLSDNFCSAPSHFRCILTKIRRVQIYFLIYNKLSNNSMNPTFLILLSAKVFILKG